MYNTNVSVLFGHFDDIRSHTQSLSHLITLLIWEQLCSFMIRDNVTKWFLTSAVAFGVLSLIAHYNRNSMKKNKNNNNNINIIIRRYCIALGFDGLGLLKEVH